MTEEFYNQINPEESWLKVISAIQNSIQNATNVDIELSKQIGVEIIELTEDRMKNKDINSEHLLIALFLCIDTLIDSRDIMKFNIMLNKELGFIDEDEEENLWKEWYKFIVKIKRVEQGLKRILSNYEGQPFLNTVIEDLERDLREYFAYDVFKDGHVEDIKIKVTRDCDTSRLKFFSNNRLVNEYLRLLEE